MGAIEGRSNGERDWGREGGKEGVTGGEREGGREGEREGGREGGREALTRQRGQVLHPCNEGGAENKLLQLNHDFQARYFIDLARKAGGRDGGREKKRVEM